MKSLGNDYKNIIEDANILLMVKRTHFFLVHYNRLLVIVVP